MIRRADACSGPRTRVVLAAAAAAAAATLGLSGAAATAGGSVAPGARGVTTGRHGAAPDGATTVWLCRPGSVGDPCVASLRATVVTASGATSAVDPRDDPSSPFDCFYVYPTVSREPSANADLRVQKAEVAAAEGQAAPFSQVCRVWSPVYRQVTLLGLLGAPGLRVPPAETAVAYDSLQAAFEDYLAHDNHGRPIVFLSHSQGAAMTILLLQRLVDRDAALRARVVLAVILGGNVEVRTGSTAGATFEHLPLCRRAGQTGCVIAYSSFPSEPPADSLFGRPGQGVSLQSDQTATTGVEVACVDPAALGGGSGTLQPELPTAGQLSTPWVSYPGLYRATCEHAGGATWLQVSPIAGAVGKRPLVAEADGPSWGYHADDVNLAIGNLVADVAAAERDFRR